MKKFHFSLERVLAWRRIQSQLESAALTKLRSERDALQEQRRLLRQQQNEARAVCGAGRFSAAEMYTLAAYQRRCEQLDAAMQAQARALETRITAQQQRVVEADRKVELLATLREQKHTIWEHEAAAAQEAFAAEAFLCRWTAAR